MSHLFCFGLGYSARALAVRLAARGWAIAGTSRDPAGVAAITRLGYRALLFDGRSPLPHSALEGVDHVLVSAPPDAEGDPILRHNGALLAQWASRICWLGYLSTTGVYGDHGGGWVSEATPLRPNTERGARRLAAERQWLELVAAGLPVHVFRLAGIYGSGRNQLRAVANGSARRVIKPGQIFSRIHVDDIATILEASMARPRPGACYNVCDDEPCPPEEVISYAARLLNAPEPPAIAFADAQLSPMAASFYSDSKRVSNALVKSELEVRLAYPSYREGLAALLSDITG